MIQFNLLPDVKLEFIKAQRIKRIVIVISGVVTIVSIVIFVFMVTLVDVFQKSNIHDLSSKISSNSKQLVNSPNLNKVLTIQNQLGTLTKLDAAKPDDTRMFKYLSQITPATAFISHIDVNFGTDAVTESGTADSYGTVNVLIDTLKVVTYNTDGSQNTGGTNAFSNVVLVGSGSQSQSNPGTQTVSYTLTFSFDPALFAASNSNIVLVIPPNTTTDRASQQLPDSSLFKHSPMSTGQ